MMYNRVWTLITAHGTLVFDEGGWLHVHGLPPIRIAKKRSAFLGTLLRAYGRVVTREEMGQALWEIQDAPASRLDKTADRLRESFPPEMEDLIRTLKGQGWCIDFTKVLRVQCRVIAPSADTPFVLAEGQTVPYGTGTTGYKLLRRMGQSPGMQTWLGRHALNRGQRLYRIATDEVRLLSIEQELASSRELELRLGARSPAPHVYRVSLRQPPYYWIETEVFGYNILAQESHVAQMSVYEREELWLKIAEALQAGHGVGVPHENLKPSNILVLISGREMRVKLADWGSSRVFEDSYLKSWEADPHGAVLYITAPDSLRYLAPELLANHELRGTLKSDVYALAVILIQLSTGDWSRTGQGFENHVPARLREPLVLATRGDPDLRIGLDEFIRLVREVNIPAPAQGQQKEHP